MDEKTAAIIEKLADKLGVTAQHLWGVLITQAPISAAINVGGIVILWLVFWRALVFVRAMEGGFGSPREILCAALVVVGGVLVFISLALGEVAIWGLLNPEYWALRQLLK